MTKLYERSEIAFAITWIVAYTILSSLADQLSQVIGVMKSATAALHVAMSLLLFSWIRNRHLSEKYGLCRSRVPAKKFLYYLPLVIIVSAAFWGGIELQYSLPEALLYFISINHKLFSSFLRLKHILDKEENRLSSYISAILR